MSTKKDKPVGGILRPRKQESAPAAPSESKTPVTASAPAAPITEAASSSGLAPTGSSLQIRESSSSSSGLAPTGSSKDVRHRSRYEVKHAHVSWTDVLQQAREYYSAPKTEEKKVRLEQFFEERGFSIKIAHSEEADSMGLFVINDEDTPTSGIVVDASDNFKVLVVPLPDVVRDESAIKFCLGNLEEYNVYRAVDGTRVTLYYVARLNAWLMSTARSYDAREFRWVGPKTYMEAFMECAHAHISPSFSLDMLNKSEIYSFIFRHHDFQPLVRDPQGLWQISGPKIEGATQYVPLAGEDIPKAEKMRFLARNSFVNFAQTGEANYGYIFRRKTSEGSPAAVYLESALHEFVRQQMYDIPATVNNLTHITRPIYLHLRGYMSLGANHAHLIMFPRAGEVYTKMEFIVGLLTDITVAEMRANTKAATSAYTLSTEQNKIGTGLFGESWTKVSETIANISKCVSERLLAANVMGAFGDHIHANVHDQYLNVSNMPEFMRILIGKKD